ncbi:MAG: FAD-dependent oxidoreductase, partial [Hyphomicrobiaceae bacterium]|nr:FAD-dependent oxidoreductase [Hyphomicrobiaceae bacterium]
MAQQLAPSASLKRPTRKSGMLHADICIIGAGSGGLSVAVGAAQMGASVVLIEKGAMGGDCLNTGCVPSKALIAAAHAAHATRHGREFGVHSPEPDVRFREVHDHVHRVIGAIAPHDSVERFESLGVHVIKAAAKFIDRNTVEADGQKITARRFVIATGSRAAVPPVPGLADAGFLTNESIFELQERPDHLIVIGGGPIGVEMAQSFRRLGAKVTLIEKVGILAKDEPEAVAVVRASLIKDGVTLLEGFSTEGVRRDGATVTVMINGGPSGSSTVTGSHVLVAAGRRPNIENLGLDAAGVASTPKG